MRLVLHDSGVGTLGIQYLLAIAKAHGHDARLFFDNSFSKDYLAQDFFLTNFLSLTPQQACDRITALEPEVVGFSMYSYLYKGHMKLIRLLKRANPELVIICGGTHPSLLPEVVLRNEEVDFVIVGEAELSFPAFLEALANSGTSQVKALPREALPGVWNMHEGAVVERGLSPIVRDLDQVVFPEKEAHYEANPALSSIYTLVTSRGCFNACTYCNSSSLNVLYRSHHERYYRARSVDNVMAELRMATTKYHPRYIEFFDDAFGAKRSWLREFCTRYKEEIGLPYDVQTIPTVLDEESLEWLADSGCVDLEVGFQAANPQVRANVLNRHETNEEVKSLVLRAIELGMFVELDLIVNLPGETREHIEESLEFIRETRPQLVSVGFLQYFPKTPIIDIAIREGVISPAHIRKIEQGEFMNSMRLLSQSGLGTRYRIIPFQMFFASRMPRWISRPLIRLVEKPLIRNVCSFCASAFLYASRLLISFTDKRDFYLRGQIIRSFYAAKWVLARKFSGTSRERALVAQSSRQTPQG